MGDHIVKLVDEIVKLNLMESNELARCLQIRLGLPDISHLMSAGGPQSNEEEEEEKEEKIIFEVKLESYEASSKVKIIKELRKMTDLTLKDAKSLVESAPAIVKKDLTKDEAEEYGKQLEAVGAKIEIV